MSSRFVLIKGSHFVFGMEIHCVLYIGSYWSRSIPGQNDSPGVVLSQDRKTPLESFYPRTEGLTWSRSIPGQNDSPGVVPSPDRMTPLESFHPRTEGLPWNRSIPRTE